MKSNLLIAFLALGTIGADSSGQANKRDIEKWQGTWHAVSMITDGMPASPDKLKDIKLTVEGTSYHFQNAGFNEHGSYRFDATKSPAELDIVVGDGADKGKVYKVIYSVSGDRLQICLETANRTRPKTFDAKAGSGCVLEVWERVKSQD